MSDAYNDAKRGNWPWGKKDKGAPITYQYEGLSDTDLENAIRDDIVNMKYDYDELLDYAIGLKFDCEILLRKLREAEEG